MSAPTTPAEMADWLEGILADDSIRAPWRSEELNIASRVIDTLRSMPTDAQKIEALKLASTCGWLAGIYHDQWGDNEMPPHSTAIDMAADARTALRLLGLPTE